MVKNSNIQLGFLFKKSLSGRKAFLKSLGEFIAEKYEKQPSVDREQKKKELQEKRDKIRLEKEENLKQRKMAKEQKD